MRLKLVLTFLITGALIGPLFPQEIVIGNKYEINSVILEDTRYYSVYLPPSYGENLLKTYPVIYLMDGDYNFRYVTGLIEQQSAISGKIPEMIVVGISDKGHAEYVKDCTPEDKKLSPDGRADRFLSFLNTELKPLMDSLYLTSPCDFIVGQSLGGLFVINALLSQPNAFQNYIAISPSLWWNDYYAKEQVPDFYEKYENLEISLYLTLGNEKGMGVFGFADALDVGDFADTYLNKTPLGLNYSFQVYPYENHNSVGLASISDGVNRVFKEYELNEEAWRNIDGFDGYIAHIARLQKLIGIGFTIPEAHLSVFAGKAIEQGPDAINAIQDFLNESMPASLADFQRMLGEAYLKNEQEDESILILRKSMNANPHCPKVYSQLAKCFIKKNDSQKAKHYYQKALETAKENKARAWYINQLEADLASIP